MPPQVKGVGGADPGVGMTAGQEADEMECFAAGTPLAVSTRFGDAGLIQSKLGDKDIVFLPRHGRDHSIAPSQINYKAQMAALKKLKADRVIGICAVGSLNKNMGAGSFAILTDFIDLTRRGTRSFFDAPGEPVVHTDFTNPYCPEVSRVLALACKRTGVNFSSSATYVGVDGPRYETPAEIRLYSSWGGDVIGMTNVPEVILAREAGLCYGAIAIITNLAAGISPTPLTHAEVRLAMRAVGENLCSVLTTAINAMPEECECDCRTNTGLAL